LMFSGDGLKVRFGVASTVPLAGGGDDDVADSVAPPPQAARRARQIKEVVRSMILSEECTCLMAINAGTREAVID